MHFFNLIDKWDKIFICKVVEWRKNSLVLFFRMTTESARGYAWALYVCVLYFLNALNLKIVKEQGLLLKAMLAPGMTWLLCNLIKRAVNRKRPYQHIPQFKALTHSPINDSFPSLHAGSTFSFAVFLFLGGLHYWPLFLLWAFVVSFSRLYLGVHYLSDLLAGAFLGSACAFFLHLILSAESFFT